jgi:hypothetical protein
MGYVGCDMMHGYKVLMKKLFGKEQPCELLLGVLEKLFEKVQTAVNAVMNPHVR